MTEAPLITLDLAEAKRVKWSRGRAIHGPEFQGNPIHELYEELVDACNYNDEALNQKLISPGMHWLAQRCLIFLEGVVKAMGTAPDEELLSVLDRDALQGEVVLLQEQVEGLKAESLRLLNEMQQLQEAAAHA